LVDPVLGDLKIQAIVNYQVAIIEKALDLFIRQNAIAAHGASSVCFSIVAWAILHGRP
jgi:hypothetical protein